MNRLLLVLALGSVAAVLAMSFVQVGGPAYARLQQNEADYARSFRDTFGWLQCKKGGGPLPDSLSDTAYCGWRAAPLADVPKNSRSRMVYSRINDNDFSLCITFELERDQFPHNLSQQDMIWNGKEVCKRGRIAKP